MDMLALAAEREAAEDAAAGECVGLVLDSSYLALSDPGALGRFQSGLRDDVAWVTGTDHSLVELVGRREGVHGRWGRGGWVARWADC